MISKQNRILLTGFTSVVSLLSIVLLLAILAGPETAAAYSVGQTPTTVEAGAAPANSGANLVPLGDPLQGYDLSLAADVNPGGADSDPYDMVWLNGKLYFSAEDPTYGGELWSYDPADGAITRLTDIYSGTGNAWPNYTVAFNNRLYFKADDGLTGAELWEYDPTTMTVTQIADIWPGSSSSSPYEMVPYGGKLYFSANDGTHGTELWVYDPAVPTTTMLVDLNPGSPTGAGASVVVMDDKLYFSGANSGNNFELWVHDPSVPTTTLVAEINPSTGGIIGSYPGAFVVSDHRLYFSARGPDLNGLFVHDPAVPTTTQVVDLSPGANDMTNPGTITAMDGLIYFRATDSTLANQKLWVYDPSVPTTTLVANVRPDYFNNPMVAFDGRLFFPDVNKNLWVHDPAVPTTTQVIDLDPSGNDSIYDLTIGGDKLYFAGNYSGTYGTELWVLQKDVGTITIIKDADPADGTDFSFVVNNGFMTAWDSSSIPGLNRPMDVVEDSAGNLYVSDRSNNVYKLDSDGNYLGQWGGPGTGDGQFSLPSRMAVDSLDNIYVVDTHNDRVQKFDSDGNYLDQWGSLGTGNGQFDTPFGVTFDSAGNIYILDSFNHRVQKFDSNHNYLDQWGSFGTGDGQFSYPLDILADSNDIIYVVDNSNHRIQKFDTSGAYLGQWGSQGSGNGQFNYPESIAINDEETTIYIADTENDQVQKFDIDGNYLGQWGSKGTAIGQFDWPEGIFVSSVGEVYVADTRNYRIQKFGPGSFILDDAVPDDGDGITSTRVISGIASGNYTVTEMVPANWSLTGLDCSGTGSWTPDLGTAVLSVTISAGDNLLCTFTNTEWPDLQLSKDDGGVTAEPGDTVAYTLVYTNAGGSATGVVLTETVPANTTFNPGASTGGWSCTPDNNAGSSCTLAVGALASNAGGSATFAVTVDNPLPLGVSQIDNNASIGGSGVGPDQNPANNSDSDSTPVNSFYAVDLSNEPFLAGDPGQTVTHTVTITNAGSNDDTFDLSLSGNSWTSNLSQSTVVLAAGAATTFQVTVAIPPGTTAGSADTVTVTAVSQTDGSATDSTDLSTVADAVFAVDLSGDDAQSGLPGNVVSYTMVITNAGNSGDIFNLSVSGNVWPVNLSQSSFSLAPGLTAVFEVGVEIPGGTAGGAMDTVTITAVSQGDGSQSDSAELTTTAQQGSYELYMPVISYNSGAAAAQAPEAKQTGGWSGLFMGLSLLPVGGWVRLQRNGRRSKPA